MKFCASLEPSFNIVILCSENFWLKAKMHLTFKLVCFSPTVESSVSNPLSSITQYLSPKLQVEKKFKISKRLEGEFENSKKFKKVLAKNTQVCTIKDQNNKTKDKGFQVKPRLKILKFLIQASSFFAKFLGI